MDERKCAHCGEPLPENAHMLRVYCNDICSDRAYYLRHRSNPEWWQRKVETNKRSYTKCREKITAYQRQYQKRRKAEQRRAAFAQTMERLIHG
jgi:hypothetical protein